MRRPSARCTKTQVTIQHATGWTKDTHGGKQPTYGAPTATINCSVQAVSGEEVDSHARDSEVIHYRVIFHDDWSMRIRDLITWGARILLVVGVTPSLAGQNRTWICDCQERK